MNKRKLTRDLSYTSVLFGILLLTTGQEALAVSRSLLNSGDYLVGANWTGGVVPGTGDGASITSGFTGTLAGTAPTLTGVLNVSGNGTLLLNSGASLQADNVTQLLSGATSGFVTQNGGLFTGTASTATIQIGTGVNGTLAATQAAVYTLNGGTFNARVINITPNNAKGSLVVNGGVVNAVTLGIGALGGVGTLAITGGSVNTTTSFNLSAGTTGSNVGTSTVTVSGGTLNLNNSIMNINTSLNSVNAKSLSVSGSGVVSLNGSSVWANAGASQEYAVMSVSGGVLNFNNGAVTLGNSSSFTGGKVTGLRTLTNNAMVINGSEFHVGGSLVASSTTSVTSAATASFTLQTGAIVFDAYGNNNADVFLKGALAAADLTGGAVRVQFNYAPQVGDSFNFVDWTGSGMSLSTGNISSTSYDGQWSVGWNTSQWTSAGILSINTVNAIPEPSLASLLVIGVGLTMGCKLLRRRRKV